MATIGVYGLVALIVRMDDFGFRLIKRSNDKGFLSKVGNMLVKLLPLVIKFFAIVGTFALLLVSGGIFIHNINYLHNHFLEIPLTLKEFAVGLLVGVALVPIVKPIKRLVAKRRSKSATKTQGH